jgi:hypothetical protein
MRVGRRTHIALWLTLAVLGGAVGLSRPARAWDEPEAALEAASTLARDYVTPHTPWARPYARGRVRGLYFIASRSEGMQTHAREAVELQQRLDLPLDVAFFYSYFRDGWFGGDAGERRVARLMGKPHDVFLFQDLSPAKLSTNPLQDGRTPFLAQVRAGAGVVLIGADDGKLFPEAQVITELPPLLAGTGAVKAYTVGQGRVIQLPARPLIGYHVGWEVEYDYWQEALTRAVLWAAKREPAVQLQVAVAPTIDRQILPAKAVTVAWQGATPGATTLSAHLRRWDGDTRDLGTVKCDRAEGQTAFEVPKSRAGAYHVELFARTGNGAQGWATAPLEITAAARIASLTLAAPHPLPERPSVLNPKNQQAWDAKTQARHDEAERRGIYTPYVEVGETIAGTVAVAGAAPGQVLRVSLRDPRGRELVRKELPATGEQAFQFKAEPWMPALLRVEATLCQGGEEVAAAYRYQRITNRRQGKFNFVLWDAPGDETLGPYGMERLADLGVTTILHHTAAPLSASAWGMSYVPWTGGNVQSGPGSSEAWQLPAYSTGFAKSMANSRGSGVLTYSLGDEGGIAGTGEGELTDPVLQEYLKNIYGTIDALNRSWDTAFTSFGDITVKVAQNSRITSTAQIPVPVKVTQPTDPEQQADDPDMPAPAQTPKAPAPPPTMPKAPGPLANLARRYDLQYFGGYNFVQMARRNREATRKMADDPYARIGFEGSGKIGRPGCDPELICRELDMWVPYTGISEEFIRSVAPRAFIRSSWQGYDRDAASHLGHYWRQVMMGADSIWYWMWSAVGAFQGFQQPDLDAPGPVREMLADTQIVRDGLGDLLLQYHMQHDGIAVLYAYPDLTAETEPRNASYRSLWAAIATWDQIIHDLNMQYNFVTERMLTSGEFEAGKYKVLVLPRTLCISAKAAAVIRRFVDNGGTVISDLRPAFYSERCKPYDKPILDDLFGVSGGCAPAVTAALTIDGKLGLETLTFARPADKRSVEVQQKLSALSERIPMPPPVDQPVLVDPAVTLTTGQALGKAGDAPACIVNAVGKGRAVLLNFVPHSSFKVRDYFSNLDAKPTQDLLPVDVAQFFLGLFHAAGVERAFNFTVYKGENVPFFPGVRVQRWRNGDYEIVGFFRQVDTEARRGSCIPDGEKWPVSPERKASGRPYTPFPYVYDLKNGLTVGQANWFIVPLDPGRAVFYARLPGPVPPMAVEAPKTARRGAPVVVKLAVPQARGLHAIKVRALLPDGTPAKFWEQTVQVAKDPVTVQLPLAYNDPAGLWTLTCTDLFGADTAQTVTITVE